MIHFTRRTLRLNLGIVALLLLLGYVDLVTGYELQFFVFYFVPVSLAAWHVGRSAGLTFAGLSAATWFVADLLSGHPYAHPVYAYWNAAIRLLAFAIMALSLAQLREKLTTEQLLRASVEMALSEVKQLKGMLPICSACKRIRNDRGAWEQLEHYIRTHSDAEFTHGLCPDCAMRLYPEVTARILARKEGGRD